MIKEEFSEMTPKEKLADASETGWLDLEAYVGRYHGCSFDALEGTPGKDASLARLNPHLWMHLGMAGKAVRVDEGVYKGSLLGKELEGAFTSIDQAREAVDEKFRDLVREKKLDDLSSEYEFHKVPAGEMSEFVGSLRGNIFNTERIDGPEGAFYEIIVEK